MPQFEVTTKSSNTVWKSPDGQRAIFEVTLDYQGQDVLAKTYSKDIAVAGWTGTVETYEKYGINGAETFVKQPQKEGGYQGSGGGGGKPAYQPKDEKAIKAMWAIGQAITWLNGTPREDSESIGLIEALANDLFNMVDKVKNQEVVVQDADTISKEDLNALFPDDDNSTVDGEKQPWPIRK